MTHLDEELLVLLALGEAGPDESSQRHLQVCGRCATDLEQLSRVVVAGRAAPSRVDLLAPPPHVWDRFAGELGTADATPRSTPTPLSSRRRLPVVLAVAAAFVAGAALAGTVAAVVVGQRDTAVRQVATASLEPFGPTGTPGRAEVVSVQGRRYLDVTLGRRTPGAGYREVWLLDPETGRLVSLGVLSGTESRLSIPTGLELGEYAVVDVSREPLDGDPAHSTDSIARGSLETLDG